MLAIVGTVPDRYFPLQAGPVSWQNEGLKIENNRFFVNRGTPALLAAASQAGQVLGLDTLYGFLVGDIGLGDGSRKLYEYLSHELPNSPFHTITFHYLQPDVDWHNKVLFAIEEMKDRPILIADAGFMYAAKMSGQAPAYDLFTPDVGEMTFLADEQAPHPFYTRGFILHDHNKVPDLITRAYEYDNAARCLLVKGEKDYVADKDGIHHIIDVPSEEAMEAIGGTGDTLTGIASALIASGMDIKQASFIAAKANRLAGYYAHPTPATSVEEIIEQIPMALEETLKEYCD
ncbi:MAG: sugar kinase [Deltaproteobacteria bacterium]|nr:sugar kinase [Deltaproteobacteria bacterium]